jgi:hypothetical protein
MLCHEAFGPPPPANPARNTCIGAQTASYGIGLWAPTLFVLQLGVTLCSFSGVGRRPV